MRTASLRNFIKLRHQLTAERETLGTRLREINEALGDMPLPSLSAISGASGESAPKAGGSRRRGKRTMSPEARARIAAAQRARWAKQKAGKPRASIKPAPNGSAERPKRKMSLAGRKAMAAAARRRWAAAKAAGKSTL